MAVIANTVLTTAAIGNREELDNIVSMITPTDTPIYSKAGKDKLASKHPEWEMESLRSPAANAQPEGNDYDFNAQVAPTRVGGRTQIFTDTWIYSGTQQVVDNAGNQERAAKAKMKAAINVRKDIELAIVTNTASSNSDPRTMGGLPSWLTSNVSRNSGSNGGFSGSDTTAESTGTLRAFTKALLDTVAQSCYVSGGNVTDLVVSPYVKSVFVTFMSDTNVASFRYAADGTGKNTIVGTADIYEGPFGKLTVTPNRVMANSAAVARRAYLNDYDLLRYGTLRPIQEDTGIAKTGDSEKGAIIHEGCLKVMNQAGLGVVADIFGLTAST
jgi:hypothetical protein